MAAILAHGGSAGLLVELAPLILLAALGVVVWRRSRRAASTVPAPPRDGDDGAPPMG